MPFIDANNTAANAILIGEQDGTAGIFLVRQTVPSGYYAGLHYHHGTKPYASSQVRSAAASVRKHGCVVPV
jgi:hypothetical protein